MLTMELPGHGLLLKCCHSGESHDILYLYSDRTSTRLIIVSLIPNKFLCGKVQIACPFCSKL